MVVLSLYRKKMNFGEYKYIFCKIFMPINWSHIRKKKFQRVEFFRGRHYIPAQWTNAIMVVIEKFFRSSLEMKTRKKTRFHFHRLFSSLLPLPPIIFWKLFNPQVLGSNFQNSKTNFHHKCTYYSNFISRCR